MKYLIAHNHDLLDLARSRPEAVRKAMRLAQAKKDEVIIYDRKPRRGQPQRWVVDGECVFPY